MRIGLVEFLLILAIASLTVGPQAALFVDRWMRRANRANARAARRRAEYAAQMAAERDALLKRFRTASTVFGVGILLALVYALVFRPIDTPPQAYTAPEVRQSTGAVQTALSADSRDVLALGDYQGVDCIREQDGFVYAAAYNGATLKKRKSDLVRTDGGSFSAILSVDGELTGFAFDADGDLWLTVLTPGGGALCRARHDSWGAAVEQVVTQIDGPRWGPSLRWRPARTARCTLPWRAGKPWTMGWKRPCAPSCWPTPAPAGCMCMTRRTGRCSGWSAAWPGHLAWP